MKPCSSVVSSKSFDVRYDKQQKPRRMVGDWHSPSTGAEIWSSETAATCLHADTDTITVDPSHVKVLSCWAHSRQITAARSVFVFFSFFFFGLSRCC